jgi:hypothetical protein
VNEELVGLLQHVELTDANWWNRSVKNFVLGALAARGATDQTGLLASIRSDYLIKVNDDTFDSCVRDLLKEGEIVEIGMRLKLSEAALARIRSEAAAVAGTEAIVKERFFACLSQFEGEGAPDDLWNVCVDRFIDPLINELGARTLELLAMDLSALKEAQSVATLAKDLTKEFGSQLASALLAFLDPADQAVRDYVLRRYNAFLAIQAAALSSDVLRAIDKLHAKPPHVRVLLDTNFVFSVLHLHDNPENELADRLQALIIELGERANVRLYVLPITLEETRRVLDSKIFNLQRVRFTRNLAAAAAEFPADGLTSRYVREAAKSADFPSPEEFFGPYVSDTLTMLRQRGVELLNENIDALRTEQGVIDDLLELQERQKKSRKQGPKQYDTNLHDMVLWHFVNKNRPAAVESPADAGYWVATLDYGLMAFDRGKRGRRKALPVCVTPAVLMNLLQFWVPRDAEFESGIVNALRLPFLFTSFDLEAERVTLRILAQLSMYEKTSDMSPEMLTRILTNRGLRGRLAASKTDEEDRTLIESAALEEASKAQEEKKRIAEELELLRGRANMDAKEAARAQGLEDQLRKRDAEIESLSLRLETTAKALGETGLRLQAAEDTQRRIDAQLASNERQTEEQNQRTLQRDARRALKRRLSLILAVVGAFAAGAGVLVAWRTKANVGLIIGVSIISWLAVWLKIARRIAPPEEAIGEWPLLERLKNADRKIVAMIYGVTIGVIATTIVDAIRHR